MVGGIPLLPGVSGYDDRHVPASAHCFLVHFLTLVVLTSYMKLPMAKRPAGVTARLDPHRALKGPSGVQAR